jgi:hypothetical protein
MSNKYDPILGEYRQNDTKFQGVLASEPSSPVDGWTYIDSTNNNLYVYYSGYWWNIGTLAVAEPTMGVKTEADDYLLTEAGEYILQEG